MRVSLLCYAATISQSLNCSFGCHLFSRLGLFSFRLISSHRSFSWKLLIASHCHRRLCHPILSHHATCPRTRHNHERRAWTYAQCGASNACASWCAGYPTTSTNFLDFSVRGSHHVQCRNQIGVTLINHIIIIPPKPPKYPTYCQISDTWDPKTSANCPFPNGPEVLHRGTEYVGSSFKRPTPPGVAWAMFPRITRQQTIVNTPNDTFLGGPELMGVILDTCWCSRIGYK